MTMMMEVTENAATRLREISAPGADAEGRFLRLAVLGGGCSGFQYEMEMVRDGLPDDIRIEKDGVMVLVDRVSVPFLIGARLDYSKELIGARIVIENPNAVSACGCGTSFSI